MIFTARIAVLFLWVLGSLLSVTPQAWAYPELVRHGYTNCTSCHISPNGGGTLTAYGRQLSKDLVSASGQEGEEAFAYSLVKPPEWLIPMAEVRGIETYFNNDFVEKAEPTLMQADLEAAVQFGKWTADATAGYQNLDPINTWTDHFVSRRHYLNYRPTDELSFRVGKFLPTFGINDPNHFIAVRRRGQLGFNDDGMETYNLEAAWIGDKINVFATYVAGNPFESPSPLEYGPALTASLSFFDRYKAGFSYFFGSENDLLGGTDHRHLFGPWGILGFSEKVYLLTELDFVRTLPYATDYTWGFANYQKLGYEFTQGFVGYLMQDFYRGDFENDATTTNSYGLGFQYWPRPHFELNLSWQLQRVTAVSPNYGDVAYAMLNFYL